MVIFFTPTQAELITSLATLTSFAMDAFIKSVRGLLGKSHEWAASSGHDYANVYNDNMMYNSLSAFFNKQQAEVTQLEYNHEFYIPYILIILALELSAVLYFLFKFYQTKRTPIPIGHNDV